MNCPHCSSSNTIRNGKTKGRQRWRCKDCRKTSIEPSGNPTGRPRLGAEPMTPAEKMRKRRARSKQQGNQGK